MKKSPEPEPVRQKSPSQDSSQESEEEEKPARQDMEITRTPTPPRHVLEAAQQASQAYRSPVQLQGPDEPTSPADCIRVELDEESEPTERPPQEDQAPQAPEPELPAPPAAPAAPAEPLKRPREPSEDLDLEAPAPLQTLHSRKPMKPEASASRALRPARSVVPRTLRRAQAPPTLPRSVKAGHGATSLQPQPQKVAKAGTVPSKH